MEWEPGDYILCIESLSGILTKGSVYKISKIRPTGVISFTITADDGVTSNFWDRNRFIHIGPENSLSAIEKAVYGI